ncbi:MAG: MFS transporter, partial [Anaerolineae bacterium]|nr:MFS transporter [Anaerolineae bacterium]
MAATSTSAHFASIDPKEYKRRVRAWTLYDWANSAFATTILAAVLPVYFSSVAGSTLPTEAIASGYWSLGLTISLLIVAILSPVLGTVSDVMRGKKAFLALFVGIGVLGTALLVLVGTGDWIMASAFAILGRIGFNGSITFYDALLPHVAREEDQDRVSALGYAIGYLGGGLLLAINVAMIQVWGFEIGARMSFVSVAVWWLAFSIPLFLRVPEPPAATAHTTGRAVFTETTARLGHTLREISHYRELMRFLIAFLIYNDGIGTIIGVAAIYATELGFGALETILVLLLVQFVGIPFSLVFGRLPNPGAKHRPAFLGFILFLIVALPSVAIAGRFLLPLDVSGAAPLPYETTETALGQGTYIVAAQDRIGREGNWADEVVAGELLKPTGLLSFL